MPRLTAADIDRIKEVLSNGGSFKLTIDAGDIPMDEATETSLGSKLHSGFELRPSTIIYSDSEAATILALGSDWTVVQVTAYRANGIIVYKKLLDGKYEADIRKAA